MTWLRHQSYSDHKVLTDFYKAVRLFSGYFVYYFMIIT